MSVKVIKLFKDTKCMDLNEIDGFYAFDRKCVIECNTGKLKSYESESYIRRTRSAG